MSSSEFDDHGWRFVTNHAHVLACIAEDPSGRLRDIAAAVGITERAVGQIVGELEQAGYLARPASDAATNTRSTASSRSATHSTATTPSGS